MDKEKILNSLKRDIEIFAQSGKSADSVMEFVCNILYDKIDYYDWVGFYLVIGKNQLKLGHFTGKPTEHTQIAFGKGICGQAAQTKKVFIIQDVSKENNYLSCSNDVSSEIVIPVLKDGEIIAELDIDSHSKSPFTDEDRIFFENVADIISKLM